MVEIKNYKEEFIPLQIELVNEVTKNWTGYGYPNADQLKQTYSNENFTPHTRYYAFEGDNLVGFLSSAIGGQEGTGNLQFPFVKKGYEDVGQKLMDKAFETFKNENVSEVTSNLQNRWEEAQEYLKTFGFEKDAVSGVQVFAETDKFDYSDENIVTNYVEVDPVADKEELIRVFQTEMTQTPEQIGNVIDGWKTAENIIMNTISKENGKIVTHSMVLKNNNDDTLAQMTHISIYDAEYKERRNEQLKFMFQQLKEKGYKRIQLFGIPVNELDTYDISYHDVVKTIRYKKKLAQLQSA